MRKRKHFLAAFMFVALLCSSILAASFINASAEVLHPYDNDAGFSLTVTCIDYSDDEQNDDLLLKTTSPLSTDGYTFQYWIKREVVTDSYKRDDGGIENLNQRQLLWGAVGDFGGAEQVFENINNEFLDANNRYNVLVRVKYQDEIVDQLYQSLTSADINRVDISSIEVNGKVVKDNLVYLTKSDLLTLKINANMPALTYSIYHKDTEVGALTAGPEHFAEFEAISFPSLEIGLNKLTVDVNGTKQELFVWVYEDSTGDNIPVITQFLDEQVGSVATFTMKVKYADGTQITQGDLTENKFNFTLVSGGQKPNGIVRLKTGGSGAPYIDAQGNIEVYFTVDYDEYKENSYGIYQTIATVGRTASNGYDDKVIIYYDGYARPAALRQEAAVYDEDSQTFIGVNSNIELGSLIKLTASDANINLNFTSGSTIDEQNLRYAFFREDASGWVLIRDYSTEDILYWKPARPGSYNIQVRLKDVNAASYEKSAMKVYNITDSDDQDILNDEDISVSITDIVSNKEVTDGILIVGRPYRLMVDHDTAIDNLFYRFTLSTKDLGTVYLNNFSTVPYCIFVPAKAYDSFLITAHTIKYTSFGFKEATSRNTLSSTLVEVEYSPTTYVINNPDYVTLEEYNGEIGGKSDIYRYHNAGNNSVGWTLVRFEGVAKIEPKNWKYLAFDFYLQDQGDFQITLTSLTDVVGASVWTNGHKVTNFNNRGVYFLNSAGNLADTVYSQNWYTMIIELNPDYQYIGVLLRSSTSARTMYLTEGRFYNATQFVSSQYYPASNYFVDTSGQAQFDFGATFNLNSYIEQNIKVYEKFKLKDSPYITVTDYDSDAIIIENGIISAKVITNTSVVLSYTATNGETVLYTLNIAIKPPYSPVGYTPENATYVEAEEYSGPIGGRSNVYKYNNKGGNSSLAWTLLKFNDRDKIAANNWKYLVFDFYLQDLGDFFITTTIITTGTGKGIWTANTDITNFNAAGIYFLNENGEKVSAISAQTWYTVVIEIQSNYTQLGVSLRSGTTAKTMYLSEGRYFTQAQFDNSNYNDYK